MTKQGIPPQDTRNPTAARLANELLAAYKGDQKLSKNTLCKLVAADLGVHPKTLAMISNGGYCGAPTYDAMTALMMDRLPADQRARLLALGEASGD